MAAIGENTSTVSSVDVSSTVATSEKITKADAISAFDAAYTLYANKVSVLKDPARHPQLSEFEDRLVADFVTLEAQKAEKGYEGVEMNGMLSCLDHQIKSVEGILEGMPPNQQLENELVTLNRQKKILELKSPPNDEGKREFLPEGKKIKNPNERATAVSKLRLVSETLRPRVSELVKHRVASVPMAKAA